MKNALTFALAGIVAMLLASSGCKKSDDSTNPSGGGPASGTGSFTLNGAGFTNQTFSVGDMMGGFSVSDNMSVVIGSTADTIVIAVAFPGSTTGTFPFSNDAGVIITSGTGIGESSLISGDGNGQVVVTAYGNVGGNITGTFSGRLYVYTNAGMDSAQVTNGSFNAVRIANQ